MLGGAEAKERVDRGRRPGAAHRHEDDAPALRVGEEDGRAEREENHESPGIGAPDSLAELAETEMLAEEDEEGQAGDEENDAQRLEGTLHAFFA